MPIGKKTFLSFKGRKYCGVFETHTWKVRIFVMLQNGAVFSWQVVGGQLHRTYPTKGWIEGKLTRSQKPRGGSLNNLRDDERREGRVGLDDRTYSGQSEWHC